MIHLHLFAFGAVLVCWVDVHFFLDLGWGWSLVPSVMRVQDTGKVSANSLERMDFPFRLHNLFKVVAVDLGSFQARKVNCIKQSSGSHTAVTCKWQNLTLNLVLLTPAQ